VAGGRASTVLVLALVLGGGQRVALASSRKPKPQPCPDAEYVAQSALIVTAPGSPRVDTVIVQGHEVGIAGACSLRRVGIKVTRQGTRITGRWPACGSLRGVRLNASISSDCRTVTGRIVAKGLQAHSFQAVSSSGLTTGTTTSTTQPTATTATSTSATSSSTTITTTTTVTTTAPIPGCDLEGANLGGITVAHNSVRDHAVPPPSPALEPLCYTASVAATAQGWADGCTYEHNPNAPMMGLGENIFAETGDATATAAGDAVAGWACEAGNYDYAANTCTLNGCPEAMGLCGHYTQVVWRSTQNLGCGLKVCTMNSPFGPDFPPTWTFVVCDYQPQGNLNMQKPY
jgi:pathogenesis-related protein 1